MATYSEIRDLFSDGELLTKVQVAVVVSANNVIQTTPTIAQKAWAAGVFANPASEAQKARMAVLAENKDLTVSQIKGATDAAIQTQVNAIVPVLVDAYSGV